MAVWVVAHISADDCAQPIALNSRSSKQGGTAEGSTARAAGSVVVEQKGLRHEGACVAGEHIAVARLERAPTPERFALELVQPRHQQTS
jgi:hypothetical protein